MIGEFYLRTLLDLYRLISKTFNDTTDQSDLSIQDTQYYVHIAYENKKLLDAHKLMLSGMHQIRCNLIRVNGPNLQWI